MFSMYKKKEMTRKTTDVNQHINPELTEEINLYTTIFTTGKYKNFSVYEVNKFDEEYIAKNRFFPDHPTPVNEAINYCYMINRMRNFNYKDYKKYLEQLREIRLN